MKRRGEEKECSKECVRRGEKKVEERKRKGEKEKWRKRRKGGGGGVCSHSS